MSTQNYSLSNLGGNGYGPSFFQSYWYDPLDPFNNVYQGFNTMANLGNTIGNTFAFTNLLNSQNRQAQYQPEAQMTSAKMYADSQLGQSQALANAQNNQTNAALQLGQQKIAQGNTILPLLISALSNLKPGSPGGGMQGFSTNFGQGASLTGAATPQTPRATGLPTT